MSEYKMIKPADMKPNVATVDVRTTAEHQAQHLLRAHDNIPLDILDPEQFAGIHGLDEDDEIYILCRSGTRAKAACDKFAKCGYKNAHVIEGGIVACEQAGEPLFSAEDESSAGAFNCSFMAKLPLERQVRVVAGALVVAGILLGGFGHSIFYLLALFVGGGLIYAGITDNCGLALLLTKAPWNKTVNMAGSSCCSAKPAAETVRSEPKVCSINKPKADESKKNAGGGCA